MGPWHSLTLAALTAGLLWRVEVEARGWEGLTWAGYFHWAVPAAVALFLAWVAWWVDAPTPGRRATVVAALLAFAVAAVPATALSLRMTFSVWGPHSFAAAPLLAWWLTAPTSVAGILALLHTPPGWRRWLVSQSLFIASVPLACLLIEVVPQHGHTDLIHTIKSGLLAPLLFLALGVVVPVRPRASLR